MYYTQTNCTDMFFVHTVYYNNIKHSTYLYIKRALHIVFTCFLIFQFIS